MSRTRGAAVIAALAHGGPAAPAPVIETVEAPPPAPALPAVYMCKPDTLDRNLEASELAEILALVLGGWSLSIGAEEWSRLRPDVRRHFKRMA